MSKETFEKWIEQVASGEATMSQRNLKWVETNGGQQKLVETVKRKGVHLVRLSDDKGNELLAASTEPFTILC